jgi:hypothetical protein
LGFNAYSEELCQTVSFSTGKWPGRDLLLDEDSPENFEVEQREERPRVEQVNSLIFKKL